MGCYRDAVREARIGGMVRAVHGFFRVKGSVTFSIEMLNAGWAPGIERSGFLTDADLDILKVAERLGFPVGGLYAVQIA